MNYADGQLSDRMSIKGGSETFYWDGLALLRRDDTNLTNEPAVTGSNNHKKSKQWQLHFLYGKTCNIIK